jgi:hypothetical protein
MGTIARPPSDEAECWCFRCLSLSREASRSVEGITRNALRNVDIWENFTAPQTMKRCGIFSSNEAEKSFTHTQVSGSRIRIFCDSLVWDCNMPEVFGDLGDVYFGSWRCLLSRLGQWDEP